MFQSYFKLLMSKSTQLPVNQLHQINLVPTAASFAVIVVENASTGYDSRVHSTT